MARRGAAGFRLVALLVVAPGAAARGQEVAVAERSVVPGHGGGLAELAGRYQVQGPSDTLVLTAERGRLYAQIRGAPPRSELLAGSATRYFTRERGINFEFAREGNRVTSVTVIGRRA